MNGERNYISVLIYEEDFPRPEKAIIRAASIEDAARIALKTADRVAVVQGELAYVFSRRNWREGTWHIGSEGVMNILAL